MKTKDSWIKIWEAPNTPVFHLYGDISAIEHQKKMFGYETRAILRLIRKEVAKAYHTSKDLEVCGAGGYTYYQDRQRFKTHIANSKKILEQFPHDKSTFIKKFDQCTNLDDFLLLLEEINKEQTLIFAYFNSTNRQFTGKIEKKLTDQLQKDFPDKSSELLEVLTRPTSLSTVQKEKLDLYSILLKYLSEISNLSDFSLASLEDKIPNCLSDLKRHLENYSFLSGHEGTDVWDMQFYIQQVQTVVDENENIEADMKRLQQYVDSTKNVKLDTIKSNDVPAETEYLADILSELSHYRLEFRIVWSSYYQFQKQIIYEISKLLQIPVRDLMALTPDLLIQSIRDKTIRKINLQARYNVQAFIVRDDEVIFSEFGKKAESRMKSEIPESGKSNARKLHGTPVFQGKVEGKAFRFDWSDPDINRKMHEMKEGDIIVIGNTKPSLMPAIQKASAIITDEGGLVCHAAIISRELQKPCVIGTHNATKVIKTGMKLKVDAVKGEVEIISKGKK